MYTCAVEVHSASATHGSTMARSGSSSARGPSSPANNNNRPNWPPAPPPPSSPLAVVIIVYARQMRCSAARVSSESPHHAVPHQCCRRQSESSLSFLSARRKQPATAGHPVTLSSFRPGPRKRVCLLRLCPAIDAPPRLAWHAACYAAAQGRGAPGRPIATVHAGQS
jgi:hypothetical protein